MPGEDETSSKTRLWKIIAFSILGILASYIFLMLMALQEMLEDLL